MAEKSHFVVFTLDNQKFALPLASVEKITRAAAVRPLPKASEMVLGVINVQGRIIPVLDLRVRFGIPTRPIDVTDHLIIARTAARTVAILVDTVQDILESDREHITDQSAILDRMEYIEGVLRLQDGMVLINDIEHMLSVDEAETLDLALLKNAKRIRKTNTVPRSGKAAG
jgi:purine-binding chemotaxis protein CheW